MRANNIVFGVVDKVTAGCDKNCYLHDNDLVAEQSPHKKYLSAFGGNVDMFKREHVNAIWLLDSMFGLKRDQHDLALKISVEDMTDPQTGKRLGNTRLLPTLGCPAIINRIVDRAMELAAYACCDPLIWQNAARYERDQEFQELTFLEDSDVGDIRYHEGLVA